MLDNEISTMNDQVGPEEDFFCNVDFEIRQIGSVERRSTCVCECFFLFFPGRQRKLGMSRMNK